MVKMNVPTSRLLTQMTSCTHYVEHMKDATNETQQLDVT